MSFSSNPTSASKLSRGCVAHLVTQMSVSYAPGIENAHITRSYISKLCWCLIACMMCTLLCTSCLPSAASGMIHVPISTWSTTLRSLALNKSRSSSLVTLDCFSCAQE